MLVLWRFAARRHFVKTCWTNDIAGMFILFIPPKEKKVKSNGRNQDPMSRGCILYMTVAPSTISHIGLLVSVNVD